MLQSNAVWHQTTLCRGPGGNFVTERGHCIYLEFLMGNAGISLYVPQLGLLSRIAMCSRARWVVEYLVLGIKIRFMSLKNQCSSRKLVYMSWHSTRYTVNSWNSSLQLTKSKVKTSKRYFSEMWKNRVFFDNFREISKKSIKIFIISYSRDENV